MKTLISKDLIDEIKSTPWDFGNAVLYNLCSENFYHRETEKILSKVWLIGRAYSAAIERGRKKELINDDFYVKKVAPAFKESEIDNNLMELKKLSELNMENLPVVLKTHHSLTQLTASITPLEKRSFSSKYLHFHLPNLFFIYDSRVVESLRQFVSRVPPKMNSIINSDSIDKEYAKFVCKCIVLHDEIREKYDINLTLRQFDNLLIHFANEKLKKIIHK